MIKTCYNYTGPAWELWPKPAHSTRGDLCPAVERNLDWDDADDDDEYAKLSCF